ncbi:DNA cytosine methyltransferase [Arsenophonus nasoniae]|uniref:DNA (cytosine-5-)-methyltransferase n=1 Tax=Arsenophonus nasoniae TaxID=638 RepID=A0ABY8NV10_9GAMM|nr:DNA cytosine methyltransferase [Arsenophonus nasoniae]WGM07776.1 DNA cytosine methyltransferase [Arsenophonus nasoniae]WGM12668.1 DNA cytosine methyltransferase [Arsenophonus nasoniae]WGM17324.1 DNA cytosine methyltransferase [Arsenophonus nasoniae]
MILSAYYNEIDPYTAQWLRNLIAAGHIVEGDVDERSIEDVKPDDLKSYTQCHFFAGIGVWSYALRHAGWPDNKPVWTGSCPCQPFSAAGKGKGFADERHLWPAFFHLIQQCKPDVIFGEQVASKDGLGWLDLVQTDLEAENYTTAALDLCAAGFGAPHIRQRLYWVADTHCAGLEGWQGMQCSDQIPARTFGMVGRLADAESNRQQRWGESAEIEKGRKPQSNVGRELPPGFERHSLPDQQCAPVSGIAGTNSLPTNGFWRKADWLCCRDGKWRPVEPCTCPLVDGITARVGRLRAYGNAIVAPVAEEFVRAYLEAKP